MGNYWLTRWNGRLGLLLVALELSEFLDLKVGRKWAITAMLPKNATIKDWDVADGFLKLKVQCPDFPIVPDGALIPTISASFTNPDNGQPQFVEWRL